MDNRNSKPKSLKKTKRQSPASNNGTTPMTKKNKSGSNKSALWFPPLVSQDMNNAQILQQLLDSLVIMDTYVINWFENSKNREVITKLTLSGDISEEMIRGHHKIIKNAISELTGLQGQVSNLSGMTQDDATTFLSNGLKIYQIGADSYEHITKIIQPIIAKFGSK